MSLIMVVKEICQLGSKRGMLVPPLGEIPTSNLNPQQTFYQTGWDMELFT